MTKIGPQKQITAQEPPCYMINSYTEDVKEEVNSSPGLLTVDSRTAMTLWRNKKDEGIKIILTPPHIGLLKTLSHKGHLVDYIVRGSKIDVEIYRSDIPYRTVKDLITLTPKNSNA